MSQTTVRRRGRVHVPRPAVPLGPLVDSWVASGIITDDQAARIRGEAETVQIAPGGLSAPPTLAHEERRALALEAIGYLGGVLVVVAAALLAGLYWADLATEARLGILGGGTAVLLGAGALVRGAQAGAAGRLRSVLWAGAVAALAAFTAVLADQVIGWGEADVALTTAACATLLAGLLWFLHPTPLQQIALMVGAMATAASAIVDFAGDDSVPGLGIWSVALVWALLGWARLMQPRTLAMALGGVGMILGAASTMEYDAGIVLALATTVGLIAAAVVMRDLVLLGVGALGTLVVVPAAVGNWFPGDLAAPVALLVVGGILVLVAVWVTRRHQA